MFQYHAPSPTPKRKVSPIAVSNNATPTNAKIIPIILIIISDKLITFTSPLTNSTPKEYGGRV